jgi:hypothetical protein
MEDREREIPTMTMKDREKRMRDRREILGE